MDGRAIVRDGYNAIAVEYLRTRRDDSNDMRLLADLMDRLPDGAAVLDAGCGAGVPVAQRLSERFAVTGVDLSEAQIALAREFVPDATFLVQDIAGLSLADESFDAVVSLYAIIHVPRELHPAVLLGFHRVLRPGGFLLLSTGAEDNDGDVDDNWLAACAPMYWSHYGRDVNLRLIADAGFTILSEELVAEDEAFGGGTHLFVMARAGGLRAGDWGLGASPC